MNTFELNPEFSKFLKNVQGFFSMGEDAEGMVARSTEIGETALRLAVLSLLVTGARTGEQVISDVTAISAGTWSPSEDVVYPALQLLEAEGLVSFELVDSKKLYSVTEAGHRWLTEHIAESKVGESEAPKNAGSMQAAFGAKRNFFKSTTLLGQAVASVVASDNKENYDAAADELVRASKAIFNILGKTK